MRVFSGQSAAILAAFFLTSSFARAQGSTPQGSQGEPALDSVVVTATRIPTRVSGLTSDITVVEREELERSGPTLREVLRSVPGVEVVQNGGPGSAMSVFIRGSNADHTLVLIDGMRISSATLGTTALENLPLDQIERIEVLRGPASSLYGSAALGGVIQIFTRATKGPNASASYGTYDTKRLSAGTGYEKDGFRFSVQLSGMDTRGFTAIRNPTGGFGAFNPDADGYRNTAFSGLLAKRFGQDSEIGIRTLYSKGRSQFDSTGSPFFTPATAAYDYKSYLTQSTTSLFARTRIGERWRTKLTVGTSVDDSAAEDFPPAPQSLFKTTQNQVVWQNDITLPVGTATLALENLRERVQATTALLLNNRSTDSLLAAYQANYGKHRIQVSGRHDDNSQFGGKSTGYVGYGYEISPAWRATAGTGTAFKAPTFNQLYFPPGFGCPAFGNPDLRPESARNVEASVRYESVAHSAGVVAYRNDVRNLINGVTMPAFPFCQQAQNVNQARIRGMTLSYGYTASEWALHANLDVLSPEDTATGLTLPRRSKRFATVSATRSVFGGRAGIEVQGFSMRYNDSANTRELGGYSLINAYFDMPIDKDWTAFARADNLGDKVYETAFDLTVPGRSLFVGIRYVPR